MASARKEIVRPKVNLADLDPSQQKVMVEAYVAFASMGGKTTTGASIRKLELTDASGKSVMCSAIGDAAVDKLNDVGLHKKYAFHNVRCTLYNGVPSLIVNDKDQFRIAEIDDVADVQGEGDQYTPAEVETLFFDTIPEDETSYGNVVIKVVSVYADMLTCIDARSVTRDLTLHAEATTYPWREKYMYCIHRVRCIRGQIHVWPSCCVESVDEADWTAMRNESDAPQQADH